MNGIALLLLMLALTVVKSGCVGVAGSGSSGGNPPTVSNPSAGNISSNGATITWTTNVPADSQVDYGTTLSYGQSSALNPALVTSHSVVLSGLTPSTLYYYRVKSKDSAGRLATSGGFTFTTASGGNPPVISSVTATNISTTGATVSWITDKPADSQVDYGTTTSYGSSTPLDPTLVTSHSQGLSGLTPGTLYHYQVKSKDGAGNQATSLDFTFTTLPDNTPPVISGVSASPSSTTAFISWTTDKPSDSQVDYGTTAAYGQSSALDPTQVTGHMVNLSGLTATTLYHYRVKSKGSNGLLATSGDNTFTTTSGGIPPGLGWFQIPNTMLASVCPPDPSPPSEGCAAVIADWSGGIADTARNRLIVWGGGHTGYYGNEVYALDLNTLQMLRLNNPSPPTSHSQCVSALSDNTPNSRHTYGGLTYIANRDRMLVYGGVPACDAGGFGFDSWALDLANVRPGVNPWTRLDLTSRGIYPCNNPGPVSGCNFSNPGDMADFDPNTGLVFMHDVFRGFYSYNYDINTWAQLTANPGAVDYHDTGIVDPVRRRFYIFGNGQAWMIDISGQDRNYVVNDIRSQLPSSCAGLYSGIYPGLAYDTRQNKIVEWSGGNSVVVFDPGTNTCATVTYPGGPPPPTFLNCGGGQQCNGTFGRFRYFPALGVFALVNDWGQNSFTLRLTP